MCPEPPKIPFEGKLENFPSVYPMKEEEVCNIDWQPLSLQCSSFETIIITKAMYGREKLKKELCNGASDSKQVKDDCMVDLTEAYEEYCRGKYNCTFHIFPTVHEWSSECSQNQINELNISYICGKRTLQ